MQSVKLLPGNLYPCRMVLQTQIYLIRLWNTSFWSIILGSLFMFFFPLILIDSLHELNLCFWFCLRAKFLYIGLFYPSEYKTYISCDPKDFKELLARFKVCWFTLIFFGMSQNYMQLTPCNRMKIQIKIRCSS